MDRFPERVLEEEESAFALTQSVFGWLEAVSASQVDQVFAHILEDQQASYEKAPHKFNQVRRFLQVHVGLRVQYTALGILCLFAAVSDIAVGLFAKGIALPTRHKGAHQVGKTLVFQGTRAIWLGLPLLFKRILHPL